MEKFQPNMEEVKSLTQHAYNCCFYEMLDKHKGVNAFNRNAVVICLTKKQYAECLLCKDRLPYLLTTNYSFIGTEWIYVFYSSSNNIRINCNTLNGKLSLPNTSSNVNLEVMLDFLNTLPESEYVIFGKAKMFWIFGIMQVIGIKERIPKSIRKVIKKWL